MIDPDGKAKRDVHKATSGDGLLLAYIGSDHDHSLVYFARLKDLQLNNSWNYVSNQWPENLC